MKHLVFTLFMFFTLQSVSAQTQCPTPEIVGDFYGCSEDILSVMVDTFNAANTYQWAVSGDAQILAPLNGSAFVELPDTNKGTFVLTLTETEPGGCMTSVSVNLTIEQNTSLTCNDLVNLSLNESCTLEVTADMILEGQPYPNDSYEVTVRDMQGNILPVMLSGSDYIHQTVEVSVMHSCSGNSCWGHILLEDKLPPVIQCPDDITVSCFDDRVFVAPSAIDNCDNSIFSVEVYNYLDLSECNDNFSAVRTLKYSAEDDWGNVSEICEYRVYYMFDNIDDVLFPDNRDGIVRDVLPCDNDPRWDENGNGYPDVEETGRPTLNGYEIFESNTVCKINSTYTDQRIDICDESFKVIREWVVLDWCSGKIVTGTQILKVLDEFGPIVTCQVGALDQVYTRPYECLADYKVTPPTVIFDCSENITYTVGYLLADDNGEAPEDGEYIDDNVEKDGDGYIIRDLPLGRTWLRYRVVDGCGNSTDCFTEVDVIDNVPPIPVCDEFTVVGLTTVDFALVYATTFDDGSYDNCGDLDFEVARMRRGCGANTSFGPSTIFCCDDIGEEQMVQLRVTDQSGNSNTCMVTVTVQDKALPIITCPDNITIDCQEPYDIASTGGMATAVDNCPGVRVELQSENENLDQCHSGTVTRVYKATDNSDQMSTCTHRITIIDRDPFEEDDINWNTVPDRELEGCIDVMTDPDITGRPTWTNDECSLVGATYEDEIFNIVDSVCLKILRKWTVLDWCTFNQNNDYGKYEYIQVIKINNTIAPEFEQCRDVTVCVEGPDCGGDVELMMPATDDCTPPAGLKYIYTIDYDNDGSIDRPGGGSDLSGYYDVGVHLVNIEVEDGCGNRDDCEFELTVEDCKEPTPYCFSEITTVIMPSSEMIDIWASDFDNGSFDNCPGELLFSFSSNVNHTQEIFNCDDLGVNTLEMWVTDEAGNQDFCSIKVNIQANDTICGGSTRIAGRVDSYDNTPMANVELFLTDLSTNESMVSVTDDAGDFALYGMNNNADYVLEAKKNTDYMNGVSTLDLVLIQRHILGITPFDSPYKLIAADVNNNEKISASDLVALRKLILGIDAEYENNQSWRFLDGTESFADESQPWPFVESITINSNDIGQTDLSFKGIKIGDVNNSAKANLREDNTSNRSSNPLVLNAVNQMFVAGDLIKVDITVDGDYTLAGFQNTFGFDKALEFLGIESGVLNINENNIGITNIDNGLISTSWNDADIKELASGDVLFSIFFKAKSENNLFNSFELNSKVTQAEAYDAQLNVEEVVLDIRNEVSQEAFTVFQNAPNPFNDNTTIVFEIGRASNVTLKVYDISGRVLHSQSNFFETGKHQFIVGSNQLNTNGVLTYSVESDLGKVVKKMVLVK